MSFLQLIDEVNVIANHLSVSDLLSFSRTCRRAHTASLSSDTWGIAVAALSKAFPYEPIEGDETEWRLSNDPRLDDAWTQSPGMQRFEALLSFVREKLLAPMEEYALGMMESNWFDSRSLATDWENYGDDRYENPVISRSRLHAAFEYPDRLAITRLLVFLHYFEREARAHH